MESAHEELADGGGARVYAVSTTEFVKDAEGNLQAVRVVDVEGRTVIPGMVDAHAHFNNLAKKLRSVDLVGTKSYDEVIARVVERARTTPKGSWIIGRGWDQNAWGNTNFPTHEALSAAMKAILGAAKGGLP